MERPDRAHAQVTAQLDVVAGREPDRLDRELEPLQARERLERREHVADDFGRHHDARRLRLAVERPNAEECRERPDVIGMAVRQQDRVDRGERARRDPRVEQDAELGHRDRRVDAADGDAAERVRAGGHGRQQRGEHSAPTLC